MHITDTEIHQKEFQKTQMMITKLSKYDPELHMEGGGSLCDFHYNALTHLKSVCEDNNYFFGSTRIPRFDFERIDDNTILNKIEFLFGRQLNTVDIANNSHISDQIWNDIVINKKDNKVLLTHLDGQTKRRFAFDDFQPDNFVINQGKRLSADAMPWTLAYVDLEAFLPCPISRSKNNFIKMGLGFENYTQHLKNNNS